MNPFYMLAGIVVAFGILWVVLKLLMVTLGFVWNLFWLGLTITILGCVGSVIYQKLNPK